MKDKNKTKAQLISELEELRKHVVQLEASDAEQKSAKNVIDTMEPNYHAIFAAVNDAIFVHDMETGEFLDVNEKGCELLGYSREELLSLDVGSISSGEPPYTQKDAMQWAKKAAEGKPQLIEWMAKDKSGQLIWVEVNLKRAPINGKDRLLAVVRDITERKRVEKRLRKSEAYMKSILKAAPIGIGLVHERVISWASDQMCEMLGYSERELVGQSARIGYESDEEFERVGKDKYSEIQERGVGTVETRFKRKDGNVIDVLLCSSPIDPEDISKGVIFTAMDITERKQAEEELRESEERFRHLSEAAFEAIVIHDQGVILQANDQYYKMFGYEPEELEGIDAIPLTATGKSAAFMKEQIALGNLGPYEVVGLRKDGATFPMEIRIKLMEYGGSTVRIAAISDLTEQRQAEEALRESEEKYRSLVESSIDGIAIVQGTEVKFANEALLDMLNISREEGILGQNFTNFISHEYKDMMLQRGLDRERGKDVPSRYEFKAMRQNGTEFDIEISVSPVSYQGKPARQAVLRDISERKQSEDALRESEEKYRLLVENLPSIVYRGYKDWSVDFFDGKVEVLTGHSMEEFNSGRMKWSELIVEEDIAGARETFIKALKTDKSYVREYRIKAKRGDIIWIQERAMIVCDDKGEIDHVNGVFFDITDRKRAEEALLESERYFRSLLFSIHEDILVIDRDYRITDVNNTLLVTVGLKFEEVIGRHCYEISHGYSEPCEKKGEDCMLREVFETGKPGNCRHQHLRADGSKVWVDILMSPLKDESGNVTHVIEAIRDVTDLVEMEDVLRESEENFRALAENAHDGILIAAGKKGINLYANKRAAELTGYSVPELLEIGLHELVAPDKVKEVADRYMRRLSGKNVPSQYETKIIRKNREIFPAELSSARSAWKGEPASIILIRDITNRKRAEEAVRKSEAELVEKSRHLEEVNAALKVLLKQRENDKADLEERLLANVKELVMPYVEKLKNSRLHSDQMTLVGILESNMKEIVSPFVTRLSSRFLSLTPTEIQVASLIKDGKTSKEIAALLNASENTVRTHRFHIRSKLGIKNRKVNFRSYLQSLQD